jgi:hypothetical protein
MIRRGLYGAGAALLVFGLAVSMAGAPRPGSISLRTTPVLLDSARPEARRVGELVFLGGLHISAADPAFGGFSGMIVSRDGTRLLAVSDMGHWLQAELVHGPDGALTGMRKARLGPMLGLDGKPLRGKLASDAEGLAADGDGVLVSFERRHRVWRYPWTDDMSASVPAALPVPEDIATIKANRGIEALARLPGGGLLLLTEASLDEEGHIRGWLGQADVWAPLRFWRAPPFALTDIALLPGGAGLLVLERRYSRLGGLGVKLRRLALGDIAPGALLTGVDIAEFRPGQSIDNFEGLAVRPDSGGAIVYLLSDDNFNGFQRTLLLAFRLAAETPPQH